MFGNLFGGGNNSSAPQNSNGEANNQQGQPGQQSGGEGQVNQSMSQQQQSGNPAGMQTPSQPTEKKGLDLWADLMQNTGSQGSDQPSSLNLPQDTISKVADGLNFSDSIPPEAMQKLQSGDFTALPDILNSVARQAYSQALQHSTGVTDKYLEGRFKQERSFGEQQARISSVTSNMSISDLPPVAQDMFRNTAKAVASKYPDLSSKQVEEQVWSMMQDMSDKFNRNKMQQEKQQKKQEVDWDSVYSGQG